MMNPSEIRKLKPGDIVQLADTNYNQVIFDSRLGPYMVDFIHGEDMVYLKDINGHPLKIGTRIPWSSEIERIDVFLTEARKACGIK